MKAQLDRLDGLLSVHNRRGSNDHGLQFFLLLQHLIVVRVGPYSLEVSRRPGQLLGVWRCDGNDFGAGGQGVEMESVTRSHAAEAGDGDLEFGGRHCLALGFCAEGSAKEQEQQLGPKR